MVAAHVDDSRDANGRGYAAHHLVHSDYYAEGQRVAG
jgi:hypothetical protein